MVAFTKGFVESVKVTGGEALLTYSFPLLPKGETQDKIGVLSSVQYGGRYWIRTSDLLRVKQAL